ncbi:MAG: hypothetical protein IPJ71_01635 [Bdellovibrionales bacterium]|jgi:hypothetical protein|nr:hypothetical protein [Bdellovibrionales bacterium]
MTKHALLLSVNLKSRNSYFGALAFLVLAILILTGSKSQANDGNKELKDIEIDALAAKMGIPLTDAAAERKRREEEENLRRERVQAEAVRFRQAVDRRNAESAHTGRALATPQRKIRLRQLSNEGLFVLPTTWQVIHDSGTKLNVSELGEAEPGSLDRPQLSVQILQRYILDDPNDKAHMEALLGTEIQYPEQIVYAIVEPKYESREQQIGHGKQARTEVSVTPISNETHGSFFYVPPDQPDVMFELDQIGQGGASVFNGITSGGGYFSVPSFPTGRLPFSINERELRLGSLRFKRSTEYRFDFYQPNQSFGSTYPKFSGMGEYVRAQVVTLRDQASADNIQLKNRAKQYEFSLYKSATDDTTSATSEGTEGSGIANLFVMATPVAASEYQLPPLFFRVNLESGQVDQFDVLKREHGWKTAFFNIEGLPGSSGYSSSSVGPLIDARTNGFLGHLNLKPETLRLTGPDIVQMGLSLSNDRNISVVELKPLNGSQLYDASIVLPILLGPLFPYPPQFLTPLFVRWELFDAFGISRTDGIHLGNVAVSVAPSLGGGALDAANSPGGSDTVVVRPNGKQMLSCLNVVRTVTNRRRASSR